MSIKRRVLAAAATMTMVGGIGAVGLLPAQASTPSCGSGCVTNPIGEEYGAPFVLDVLRQGEKVGQPVILFRTSNSDPAEDFTIADTGTVGSFATAGLVSPALALHYGGGCETYTTTAGVTTCTLSYPNDMAYEVEYAPYGVDSGLCVGVGSTAGNGTPVVLEQCGVSSKTLWVVPASGGVLTYYPWINGSGTNFSTPYVLHYPGNAYPTDMPRPQLNTYSLQQSANGSFPTDVYNNEMWTVPTAS